MLIELKRFVPNRGLVSPSDDVISLRSAAEKVFKTNSNSNVNLEKMTVQVLKTVTRPVYTGLHLHQFDDEPSNNHVVILMKNIAGLSR